MTATTAQSARVDVLTAEAPLIVLAGEWKFADWRLEKNTEERKSSERS